MHLATIEAKRPEARKAFLEYKRAFRETGNPVDEQIMRGYRELSKGRTLVSLNATMAVAGVDERGLPRLAIAQANEDFAHTNPVNADGSGQIVWGPHVLWGGLGWDGRINRSRWSREFPPGTFKVPNPYSRSGKHFVAMLPLIPPALRPPHKLENYHVLWEADWREVRPPAPKDPALLRHIGGDLYAVLAVWDLTPLERSVLGG